MVKVYKGKIQQSEIDIVLRKRRDEKVFRGERA